MAEEMESAPVQESGSETASADTGQTNGNTLLGGNTAAVDTAQADASVSQTDNGEAEKQAAQLDPANYKLTMPEGSGFTDAHKAQFVEIAKDMGLTEKQTQQLVERSAKANADTQAAQTAARNEQVDAWNAELKADKDFGGTAFDQNVQYAMAGLNHIDPDGKLGELLNSSGYGSNPAVLKALARLGKDLNDDKIIGKGTAAGDSSLAERLYPEMFNN